MAKRVLFLVLFFSTIQLFAQPGNPGGDPDVPISGIEWLIGGGFIIGLRSLVKRKNKE